MSTKAFVAKTFRWLHQVNRGRYLAIDLKVALQLTVHFNEKDQDGRAFPSCKTIADAVGVSEHTVMRSVDRMHAGGDLYVIWGKPGRGYPNQYWMVIKPAPTQVSEAGKPAPRPRQKTCTGEIKTCIAVQENLLRTSEEGESLKGLPLPPGEREEALTRFDDSIDRGGALDAPARSFLDPTEIVPPPNQSKESGEEELEIADGAEAETEPELVASEPTDVLLVVPLDQERDWRELRELWDRGHIRDDLPKEIAIARNAYSKARAIAEHGEIIAGARVHVAAADAPKYLLPLAQWLAARGWEKPPPAKAKHVKRGNNGYQRKGKADLARTALKMGGYKDENGDLSHPDGDVGSSFDWRASQ
jgi:hypothetical protein